MSISEKGLGEIGTWCTCDQTKLELCHGLDRFFGSRLWDREGCIVLHTLAGTGYWLLEANLRVIELWLGCPYVGICNVFLLG